MADKTGHLNSRMAFFLTKFRRKSISGCTHLNERNEYFDIWGRRNEKTLKLIYKTTLLHNAFHIYKRNHSSKDLYLNLHKWYTSQIGQNRVLLALAVYRSIFCTDIGICMYCHVHLYLYLYFYFSFLSYFSLYLYLYFHACWLTWLLRTPLPGSSILPFSPLPLHPTSSTPPERKNIASNI